jgi:hypothetical protein
LYIIAKEGGDDGDIFSSKSNESSELNMKKQLTTDKMKNRSDIPDTTQGITLKYVEKVFQNAKIIIE